MKKKKIGWNDTTLPKNEKSPPFQFTPNLLNKEEFLKSLQEAIIDVVYSYWKEKKIPINLDEIYSRLKVYEPVIEVHIPAKNTVDRRVSEAASTDKNNFTLKLGRPQIVRVKAGLYEPSPETFHDVGRWKSDNRPGGRKKIKKVWW